jgi:hypothetical protein
VFTCNPTPVQQSFHSLDNECGRSECNSKEEHDAAKKKYNNEFQIFQHQSENSRQDNARCDEIRETWVGAAVDWVFELKMNHYNLARLYIKQVLKYLDGNVGQLGVLVALGQQVLSKIAV